jgi:hypothetical protein
MSFESTQEIGHAVYLINYSNDMAFNKKCFLGYPARQFFLPSLPTLIMGRKVLAINLGGSLYVIIGLLIFSRSISINFEDRRYGDLAGGIILSLIFHIYYVNYQIFWFEQSIYPFGFTLIICGLYLHYIKNQSVTYLSLTGLAIFYLIYSYTPSLSMACLSITVLIYYYIKNFKETDKKRNIIIAMIIIFCIISFFLSFKYRSDVNLTGENKNQFTNEIIDKNKIQSANDITGKINELFLINTQVIVTPVSTFIFSFILIFSIFFVFRWTMFFLTMWIIGTVIISVASSGYALPPTCFAIHRAIIIYPVMFIMFINIIKSINIDFKRKYHAGIIILIFLLITGIIYQQSYLKTKTMDNSRIHQLILIRWLKETITEKDINKKSIIFYFDEIFKGEPYISIHDTMMYFSPEYNISFPDSKTDLLNKIISSRSNFLLVPPDGLKKKCYINIKNRLKYISSFCGKEAMDLYKIE